MGFSLRLGLNATYCYTANHPQSLTKYVQLDNDFIKFKWISQEGDFGYPLEISSSIYLISTLLPFLATIHFRNPNELEGGLASRKAIFSKTRPELFSFVQSVTFCNPVNIVQSFYPNLFRGTIPLQCG